MVTTFNSPKGLEMDTTEEQGTAIRTLAKALVYNYMRSQKQCHVGQEGMRLSQIFRACGFDWGDYPKTTSSNQQYWVGAIMWELAAEGRVERVTDSGPWRLKSD